MIVVPDNLERLAQKIVRVCTYAIEGKNSFPRSMSFDDGFESIRRGVELLRPKFQRGVADQLLDMAEQAKSHFEADERKLGAWLLQDIERLLLEKEPFAYPIELYRWPRP